MADLVIPPPKYGTYTYVSIIQLLEIAPQDTVKVDLGLLLHYFHTLLTFVFVGVQISYIWMKCIPPLRNIETLDKLQL